MEKILICIQGKTGFLFKMNIEFNEQNKGYPQEIKERLTAISFAKANLELEGETISPEVLEAGKMFANGEITYEAFLAVGE